VLAAISVLIKGQSRRAALSSQYKLTMQGRFEVSRRIVDGWIDAGMKWEKTKRFS
jgi:hypothetical protein